MNSAPATSAPATSAPAAPATSARPREVKAKPSPLVKAINDASAELGRLASKHGLSFAITGKTGKGEDVRLKAESGELSKVPEKDKARIIDLAAIVSAARSLKAKLNKAGFEV